MAELACPEAELSILLVDDVRIQELNRRYLHRDRPTNVLAFSMKEGDFSTLHPHLLGDVVISIETAERESDRFGLKAGEMVLLLVIHGILHLMGYDHEKLGRKAAREMAARQKELLRLVTKRNEAKRYDRRPARGRSHEL